MCAWRSRCDPGSGVKTSRLHRCSLWVLLRHPPRRSSLRPRSPRRPARLGPAAPTAPSPMPHAYAHSLMIGRRTGQVSVDRRRVIPSFPAAPSVVLSNPATSTTPSQRSRRRAGGAPRRPCSTASVTACPRGQRWKRFAVSGQDDEICSQRCGRITDSWAAEACQWWPEGCQGDDKRVCLRYQTPAEVRELAERECTAAVFRTGTLDLHVVVFCQVAW